MALDHLALDHLAQQHQYHHIILLASFNVYKLIGNNCVTYIIKDFIYFSVKWRFEKRIIELISLLQDCKWNTAVLLEEIVIGYIGHITQPYFNVKSSTHSEKWSYITLILQIPINQKYSKNPKRKRSPHQKWPKHWFKPWPWKIWEEYKYIYFFKSVDEKSWLIVILGM